VVILWFLFDLLNKLQHYVSHTIPLILGKRFYSAMRILKAGKHFFPLPSVMWQSTSMARPCFVTSKKACELELPILWITQGVLLLFALLTCLEQIHSQDLNVSNSKYAFHNVYKNKDDVITFL